MLCEVPLTKEQQDFATAHHGLVYKFLNAHQLPEDEFYDVVIFGYLKAIQDYFCRNDLQKYSFSTIAWRYMARSLSNHYKSKFCKKRNADVVSIHLCLRPDEAPLEAIIPAHDPLMQQLEMELLLHDLASRVSKQQMDIVSLKRHGYGIREIARSQRVPMRRIKELLAEVHEILLELCCQ